MPASAKIITGLLSGVAEGITCSINKKIMEEAVNSSSPELEASRQLLLLKACSS